jgi:hypothetical protein
MYCMHCGADEQQSKAYCRHCGKWIGSSAPEERITVMIIFNGLSALFGAASAIALLSNSTKGAEWPVNLAATFCLIISVYQTICFIFALGLRRRLKRGKDQSDLDSPREIPILQAADTSQFVRPPSVIENTTELLERKKR